MGLWIDDYRPIALDQLTYHKEITHHLNRIASNAESMPHLLVSGPSGAGKKTRISCFLRALYGTNVSKLKSETRTFKIESRTLEINIVSSLCHIELTPSDVGNNDRLVVQSLLKEMAQTSNINAQRQKSFKVIVLNEADRLSKAAQQALRRTMEKYVSKCRLILVCEQVSKILDPLKSRCLPIRIGAPTREDVSRVLSSISAMEQLEVSRDVIDEIVETSQRNLRKAILLLETYYVHQSNSQETQSTVLQSEWEKCCIQIGNHMIEKQTPHQILLVRQKMYELIGNCIPPALILKTLLERIVQALPDPQLKYATVALASEFDERLRKASKPIIQLEAFVAKFMVLYKGWFLDQLPQ